VTAFMDGLTTPGARAKNNKGFIDFVVFPLLDPMCRIFEGWAEPLASLHENRRQSELIVAEETATNTI